MKLSTVYRDQIFYKKDIVTTIIKRELNEIKVQKTKSILSTRE